MVQTGFSATYREGFCIVDKNAHDIDSDADTKASDSECQPDEVISTKMSTVNVKPGREMVGVGKVSVKRCSDDVVMSSAEAAATEAVVCTGEKFVESLGVVLTHWVQASAVTGATHKMGRFHTVRAPSISISDYLQRIHKYFMCSDECFVMALVYMDRASKGNTSMTVCDLTVHRLLIIAVMIAVKFHDDLYYSNEYYAKVGGMSLKEANTLEVAWIKALNWNLVVSPEEYNLYHALVCKATDPCEQ